MYPDFPHYVLVLSYQHGITQLTTPNSALQLVIVKGDTEYPMGSRGFDKCTSDSKWIFTEALAKVKSQREL